MTLVTLLSCRIASAENNHSPASQGEGNGQQQSSGPFESKPSAYQYPYSCDRPKDAEQDNLCIERQANKWSKQTFFIGIAGTFGLVISLIASAITTKAALDAVSAAKETLHNDRAWVMPVELTFRLIESGSRKGNIQIGAVWKNCGNSPAIDIVSAYDFAQIVPRAALQDMAATAGTIQNRGNLGQGESFVRAVDFNKTMLGPVISGERDFHLYVMATYFDIFKPRRQRTSEARFIVKYDATQSKENRYYAIPAAIQNRVK